MPRNNPDFHDSRNVENYHVERHYTPGQLAKELGVHRNTVARWAKAGQFGDNSHQTLGGMRGPGEHRIRVSRATIDSYLGIPAPDFSAEKPKKPRKPKSA